MIGLENQILAFLRVALLDRFYWNHPHFQTNPIFEHVQKWLEWSDSSYFTHL